MKNEPAPFDDDYEELDEFEDEEDEDDRGLSGLAVLGLGVVMLGAVASVVFIAYKQGVKTGGAMENGAPYVTADPEPLKIENAVADEADRDREVYDQFDGETSEPVETIAEGPEEPVARDLDDPIGAIAADAGTANHVTEDAVAERIAELAAADEALPDQTADAETEAAPPPDPEAQPATEATPTSASAASAPSGGEALAGSHLVQVGAFRSEGEADAQWERLRNKHGDYLDGKADDIETADLGDKGVYYRLRIGPFASADAAKDWCAGLKERGTDCLIRAK